MNTEGAFFSRKNDVGGRMGVVLYWRRPPALLSPPPKLPLDGVIRHHGTFLVHIFQRQYPIPQLLFTSSSHLLRILTYPSLCHNLRGPRFRGHELLNSRSAVHGFAGIIILLALDSFGFDQNAVSSGECGEEREKKREREEDIATVEARAGHGDKKILHCASRRVLCWN